MNLNEKVNIAIISHFTFKEDEKAEVFPGNIRNFLIKRIGKVAYIDHPFIKSQGVSSDFISSQLRIYNQGVKVNQLTTPGIRLPGLILFIYQSLLTIFFIIIKPVKYDLCIACDNLSLISVLIFRRIGLIKKLVYYTVDYTPKRYSNPILNSLYQYMDRLASKASDTNWVAVENMITSKAENGMNLQRCSPFQVVPIGFSREEIVIKPIKELDKFNLVFIGLLFEKQGVQLVVKVLPKLIKKFPEIHLTIIGSGPYEEQIRSLVKKLGVSSLVKFTGYMNNQQEIVKLLSGCGIGLATYVPSIGDYTYAADPSKIKIYLLCGLPVITTRVPPVAKEIDKRKAGLVIEYSEEELIKSLEYLLKSDKIYSGFRENALKMAKAYDTELILENAFKKLPG